MYIIKISIKSIVKFIPVNSGKNNKKVFFLNHHYTHLKIKRQNGNELSH